MHKNGRVTGKFIHKQVAFNWLELGRELNIYFNPIISKRIKIYFLKKKSRKQLRNLILSRIYHRRSAYLNDI